MEGNGYLSGCAGCLRCGRVAPRISCPRPFSTLGADGRRCSSSMTAWLPGCMGSPRTCVGATCEVPTDSAALARLSVSFPEPDPADDVAHRLDEQQRAEQTLHLLELLPERDQDLFILCVWQ